WRDLQRRSAARGIRIDWDDGAAFAAHEEMSPERVLGYEQELERVLAALQQLPERTRDVLLLTRLELMRQTEVAEMFAISVSAVEKHIARALAHLARAAVHGPDP